MGIRTFNDEKTLSPTEAFVKLRSGVTEALKAYMAQHSLAAPKTILDVGCSTGLSTTWMAQQFAGAAVTGLDLSPYFLAVAEFERRKGLAAPSAEHLGRVTYERGLAERTGRPSGSVDLVAFQFIIHECPQQAIRDFVAEARRITRPGGVCAFVDNNPRSETIQKLPAPIFTLMKSTEPWSDEYYSFDLEAAMREAGFKEVVTVETDHRHRAVMGIAP